MLYLGTDAAKFPMKKLDKFFVKIMPTKAKKMWAMQNCHNLTQQSGMLDLFEEIDDILEIEEDIEEGENHDRKI